MSREDVARVDFYFDDWLTGTMELSAELRGAYITVCALIWKTGNRLKDNEAVVARWCAMSVRKWRSVRQALIEAGKLEIADGYLRQRRAEAELEAARERREKARENGAKGGHKKAENEAKARKSNDTAPGGANSYQHRIRLREEGDTPPKPPPATAAEPPPAEPPEKPPRARERDRGTRLPENWQPSEAEIAFAEREGLDHDEINREADKYRDYWRGVGGQRGRKPDWQATWRNWCRKAGDDKRRFATRARPAAGYGGYDRGAGRSTSIVAGSAEALRRRKQMAGQSIQ